MKPSRYLTSLALLAFAATAPAHDTWLLASDYFVEPDETIALGMTSGMGFPAADYAIKPERVEVAQLHLAGETQAIDPSRRGEHALHFEVTPQTAGVARIRVSLAPNPIELTPEDVVHYLEEIGAPERVWKAWRDSPEPRQWKELYTKHAVAYVCVGEPSNAAFNLEPIGLPLEFVPRQDPTELEPGDTLAVQVLKAGQPYPGFSVGVAPPNAEAQLLQADDEGKVNIAISGPGPYLIRGTDITQSDLADAGWVSHFFTLTFAVRD